jgi:hypothetical protein
MWKLDGNQMLKHTKEYVFCQRKLYGSTIMQQLASKQLCKYLIPYVIKFILMNGVNQNSFICFGCYDFNYISIVLLASLK